MCQIKGEINLAILFLHFFLFAVGLLAFSLPFQRFSSIFHCFRWFSNVFPLFSMVFNDFLTLSISFSIVLLVFSRLCIGLSILVIAFLALFIDFPSNSLIFIVLHDSGFRVAVACDLVLVLVVLAPRCCFSRLFASMFNIGLQDFGIIVVVVAVDFPVRGRAGGRAQRLPRNAFHWTCTHCCFSRLFGSTFDGVICYCCGCGCRFWLL